MKLNSAGTCFVFYNIRSSNLSVATSIPWKCRTSFSGHCCSMRINHCPRGIIFWITPEAGAPSPGVIANTSARWNVLGVHLHPADADANVSQFFNRQIFRDHFHTLERRVWSHSPLDKSRQLDVSLNVENPAALTHLIRNKRNRHLNLHLQMAARPSALHPPGKSQTQIKTLNTFIC